MRFPCGAWVFLVFSCVLSNRCLWADEPLLLEDDLLGDETILFEPPRFSEPDSWFDDIRTTFQQTHSQGHHAEISRSELRLEYESAPWQGAYVRLDNKYRYFWHDDALARQQNGAYGSNKLQQASLQLSHKQCAVTLGRQRLFWGVVEGTFAVDVVSPFDYTEQLLTDYANVRLSQDMLIVDCFASDSQLQVFYQPDARLDAFRHKNNQLFELLEDRLHDEWGVGFSQRWPGVDLTLMYAYLYGNTPVVVADSGVITGFSLDVPRYHFFGFSSAWAVGRLLVELDVSYKTDQLEAYSDHNKDRTEGAFGLEYTTAANHHFNAGLWLYDEQPSKPGEISRLTQAWTAGWGKSYMNDNLDLSFLGSWISESEQLSATLLAQYQWDDYWELSSALSYLDLNNHNRNLRLPASDLTATAMVKLQF